MYKILMVVLRIVHSIQRIVDTIRFSVQRHSKTQGVTNNKETLQEVNNEVSNESVQNENV